MGKPCTLRVQTPPQLGLQLPPPTVKRHVIQPAGTKINILLLTLYETNENGSHGNQLNHCIVKFRKTLIMSMF